MKCIPQKDLAKYLVGEVTLSQAEEMEKHLSSCKACMQELEAMREMVGRISESTEQVEQKDHLPEVRRRIDLGDDGFRYRRRRWPVFALAGAAIIALAVAGFLVFGSTGQDDEFRVKADEPPISEQDRWVGIEAFRMRGSGAPVSLGDEVRKSDYLILTYTNLGVRPYDYLMIFAVDEQGEVYWFHPAYTQKGEDPLSIKIAKGADRVELREQVRHDYPEGKLWIYGLFTRKPLGVSSVEQMVKNTARGERFPVKGSGQHVLTTEVAP
jgi:hypothetical protein